jgi:D-alanyl-D-alanine endopeptidase (penicillin-binding protein 7)
MRSTGLTEEAFIAEMNSTVKAWGLSHTFFVEPTGLDERNVSTAREMALIAQKVFKNADVMRATTSGWVQVAYTRGTEQKTEWIKNTNKLLDRDVYVTGGKTGYTTEAGYNLVTRAKNKKHELTVLVLGSKIKMNYEEVYALLKKYL